MDIQSAIHAMSIEALVGQLFCFNVSPEMSDAEFERVLTETAAGGVFLTGPSLKKAKLYQDIMKKATGLPGLVAADLEAGPGAAFTPDGEQIPHAMAQGACDDPAEVERLCQAVSEVCRENGVNMKLTPVVDINMNPDNPVVNIRAVSDSATQVIKIAGAQLRGFQKDGLMVSCCKHFPGDGVDDRNQHFCTTVNSLSQEDWMESFGRVYKSMFKEGAACVMVGHISLPAFQDPSECSDIGVWLPGTLSYSIITKLLREKLGFDGCVISDAMSMVGACAAIPTERLCIEFIKAGGDLILYPLREDYDRVLSAVKTGEISMERLRDAVRHVLQLKEKARLYEEENVKREITHQYNLKEEANRVGERAVKIVRNADALVPLSLEKGAKILNIEIVSQKDTTGFIFVREELEKRGYAVETLRNPKHYDVAEKIDSADCVLVNCRLSSQTYPGGSLRIGWEHIMAFWRGYIFRHPKVIFTSFGDPYKLHDFPFLRTYINTFSDSPASQRGFVKVLLGEAEEKAKSPVRLAGYFERDVE